MHGYSGGGFICFLSFVALLLSAGVWWRDITREGTYQGHHTAIVQVGLRYGMLLFIASEVMFFLAFFWAFFHSSLGPTILELFGHQKVSQYLILGKFHY